MYTNYSFTISIHVPDFAVLNNSKAPITHLQFSGYFDKPVDGLLPATVTNLYFGSEFNRPLTILPPGLTHLTIGFAFNQSLVT